jgi:hypothetical protein
MAIPKLREAALFVRSSSFDWGFPDHHTGDYNRVAQRLALSNFDFRPRYSISALPKPL